MAGLREWLRGKKGADDADGGATTYEVQRSDEEWREQLSPEAYRVLRKAGTERPWTGALLDVHDDGTWTCGACGNELFDTDAKFDSGTGWPSFSGPKAREQVELVRDVSIVGVRTEVRCARCGSHLGHVFPDGPAPTRQRYCMNSLALEFRPDEA